MLAELEPQKAESAQKHRAYKDRDGSSSGDGTGTGAGSNSTVEVSQLDAVEMRQKEQETCASSAGRRPPPSLLQLRPIPTQRTRKST